MRQVKRCKWETVFVVLSQSGLQLIFKVLAHTTIRPCLFYCQTSYQFSLCWSHKQKILRSAENIPLLISVFSLQMEELHNEIASMLYDSVNGHIYKYAYFAASRLSWKRSRLIISVVILCNLMFELVLNLFVSFIIWRGRMLGSYPKYIWFFFYNSLMNEGQSLQMTTTFWGDSVNQCNLNGLFGK